MELETNIDQRNFNGNMLHKGFECHDTNFFWN